MTSPYLEIGREADRLGCELYWNEPLRNHSSWRIGGPADLLLEPGSLEHLAGLVGMLSASGVPFLVIGQGTNLLFADAGLRGVVLKIGSRLSAISISGAGITAEAGIWVPELARKACSAGVSGLEHIIGIPGTLGGLVKMNGGSQRRCIGDSVVRVWTILPDGSEQCLSAGECGFAYRFSLLQASGCLITKVELEGVPRAAAQIRGEMLGILRDRRKKFPLKQPSCGSVFLSTAELHAAVGPPGKVIEDALLKGARCGDAVVSPKHANFIVNTGDALAQDVITLVKTIKSTVHERFGVMLECEVRYINQGLKEDKDVFHL